MLRSTAELLDMAEPFELFVGGGAVFEEVERMLAASTRQTILVCPFLTLDGVRRFEGLLGTRQQYSSIVVIHGIEQDLSEAAMAAAEKFGDADRVVVESHVGARTHAKLLVQDGSAVMFATKNFLSSGPDARLFDVGVRIDGREVASEVLAWGKRVAPLGIAKRARWRTDELGRASTTPITYHSVPPPRNIPSRFIEIAAEIERLVDATSGVTRLRAIVAGIRAWYQQVHSGTENDVAEATPLDDIVGFLELMAEQLDEASCAPWRTVETHLHRPMLFDALEHAVDYVLVSSHRLGRRPLGLNFRCALQRALDRGITVVLAWGEKGDEGVDGKVVETQIAHLRDLAAGRKGHLVINDRPLSIHCKLLTMDHTSVVVTSFEFLHFLDNRDYTRHELGIWIGSRRAARTLLRALCDLAQKADPAFSHEVSSLLLSEVSN